MDKKIASVSISFMRSPRSAYSEEGLIRRAFSDLIFRIAQNKSATYHLEYCTLKHSGPCVIELTLENISIPEGEFQLAVRMSIAKVIMMCELQIMKIEMEYKEESSSS